MWRRWGHREPVANDPSQSHFIPLDEEENYLETIPEVDSRPQSLARLPDLPFRAVPPINRAPQRESVYSQPSPTLAPQYIPPQSQNLTVDTSEEYDRHSAEISPLSDEGSVYEEDHLSNRTVSPIDSNLTNHVLGLRAEPRPQSQIPQRIPVPTSADRAQKEHTKWDEYSGEPTQSDKGKIGSARPGAAPVEMQFPQLKERTKQILAGLRERDALKIHGNKKVWEQQVSPTAADPMDHPPPQKQPWKGASGRTAIVEPLKNTPAARIEPIQISQDNTKFARERRPTQETLPDSSPTHPTIRPVQSEESLRPAVPPHTFMRKPIPDSAPPTAALQSPFHSPHPPSRQYENHTDVFTARVESPPYDPEPTTPTTPTHAGASDDIDKQPATPTGLAPPGMEDEVSRFSWTTYATTNAGSPRSIAQVVRDSSPPPPMPEVPDISIPKRNRSPYLHASGALSTGSVVIRKPLPKRSFSTDRYGSNSKDLPPVPTELEAADKITGFEAQLEALDRRKHNVSRIVRDLESNLKKNAVVYDLWKRREVERSISKHKEELDSITQEAHELGLQLHRAQKKRDRDDNYEKPTGLWIKRVTS